MQDILKELSSVFQLVSTIPVTGDSIDTMAVVRARLRRIYADVEKVSAKMDVEVEDPQE